MDRGHTQIATLLLEYMKDYKVSTSLGVGTKKNAASTSISRTGRLSIDVTVSDGTEEADLLAQGLGEEYDTVGEVSLQVNAHLPPSPKSATGTPLKSGVVGELPRPHTQSSPQQTNGKGSGYTQSAHPLYPHQSPLPNKLPPSNGTEMSPGAGQYRVLENPRMRASSEGMLPPTHTSPIQPP